MSNRKSGRVGSTRPSWFSSLLVKASSTPGPQSHPICFPLPRRGLLRHQVLDLKLKHVSLCRYWNGIELLSMRVFTALSAAVYKKSLTLSSTGRNQYTAGQVLYNKSSGSFGFGLFPPFHSQYKMTQLRFNFLSTKTHEPKCETTATHLLQ